jgi:FtsP/CotA-like multicopper oxidase with cupredoxin domain
MNGPANKQNNSPAPDPSRRGFLASALATALGVSLADLISPVELGAAAPPDCSKAGDAFVPVLEFVSKNGKLAARMTVKATEKSIATIAGQGYQCRPMKVRYYEGEDLNNPAGKWPVNPVLPGPGPTLRMRVGDQVQIRLHNAINPAVFGKTTSNDMACNVASVFDPAGAPKPLYPGTDTAPSCLHGDNLTNLHYHGTHVTPDGHGDNVMVDVHPIGPKFKKGETYLNDFTIPLPPPSSNSTDHSQPFKMGQAPGTHWYHAHKHGSVALQLLNGMAGAMVIEGEFDDQLEALMPGLRKTEKVLVIQQIGDNIEIQPGPPIFTCAGGDPLPLVNGQLQPTIEMKPGEIQRWRIVNATMQQVAHLSYRFLGEGAYSASKGGDFPTDPGYAPEIRQIAYDGVQLAPERYNDAASGLSQEFTVASGNRIDILVKAPATAGKSLLAFRMLHKPPAGCQIRASLPDLILVNLQVAGAPVSPEMNLPTASNYPAMPAWLQWDESDPRNNIVKERILKFNNDNTGRPAIDGKAFDQKPDTTQYLTLNTAEEWTLENYWDSSIHPFHIHVNPFQVLEIFDPNATTQVTLQAPYNWRDTIAIPASKTVGTTITPGRVKIRSRYVDFPGTFVLHCHILDHEDRGMMQEVQILDPAAKAAPPLPMHH